MVRALLSTPHPALHPDGKRIAGMATAILINVALLMLLLVPMRAPPTLQLPDPTPLLSWIVPKPVVPPAPPVPVPVIKSHPQEQPRHVVQVQPEAPPQDPPVVLQQGKQEQAQPPGGDTNGTSQPPHEDIAGVRLEYADAPAPAYPLDALRDGTEGTVLLQVLVDVDGRPLQVDVQRSSGDRRLDIAARRQVLTRWRFRPAMRDGRAVQAIGLVPVAFSLR